MSNKYSPGQRLNTAADVMQALLDGEKVTGTPLCKDYFHLVDGGFEHSSGVKGSVFRPLDWCYIYTPPKRKIVSTRWFAIFPPTWAGPGDPKVPNWSWPYLSEVLVKEAFPNALAYVKAEVEVEVEG